MTRREEIDDLGAEVVPGPLEFRSGVAEAHDEQVGRGPPARRRQQSPQGLALPARVASGLGRGLATGPFAFGPFAFGPFAFRRAFLGGLHAWRLPGGDDRLGIDLGDDVGGKGDVRHPHGRPDDQIADVHLEVGGDVGGARARW